MKIIFSGGGTIGSVSPLLAIAEATRQQQGDAEFLWLATKNGPEKKLIFEYKIPVKEITAGKFRRYFDLRNFFMPLFIFFGFIQSFFIILKFKPSVILSAGGYVAVPVVWAGWFLKVPCIIHQQDVLPGLANKLMSPFAKVISVTFEQSLKDFPAKKTILTGNPVRPDILTGDRHQAYDFFKLDSSKSTVLIIGGGTGAEKLNNLVIKSLGNLLSFCQVIHITGGKSENIAEHSNYRHYDFLTKEMKLAYVAADIIVSRAGMSALSELQALRKPSIIIPMPNSHQEANATEFFKKNAIAMLNQSDLTPENFSASIKHLLEDKVEQQNLVRNMEKVLPINATEKILATFL